MANTRQYSPILISDNIDQSDWPILKIKTTLGKVQPWITHPEDRPKNIRAMVAFTAVEGVSMLRDLWLIQH